jgi:protein involved in temperature-dependent protein secretion
VIWFGVATRIGTAMISTIRHDPQMIAEVESALCAADYGLQEIREAYEHGKRINRQKIKWVRDTSHKLGHLIAVFEDGHGFGRIPLCMINQLRVEEDIATSLHAALTAPAARKEAA